MKLSLHDHLSATGLAKWIAEIGCKDVPTTRQNLQTALHFFAEFMPRLEVRVALSFVVAMDLYRPVRRVQLQTGDRLMAFRLGDESQFKTFFTRRGRSPTNLGINTAKPKSPAAGAPTPPERGAAQPGRNAVHFVVRTPVWVLETYTTGAIDVWTKPVAGQRLSFSPRMAQLFGPDNAFGVQAGGGGVQVIVPESYANLLVEEPPEQGANR